MFSNHPLIVWPLWPCHDSVYGFALHSSVSVRLFSQHVRMQLFGPLFMAISQFQVEAVNMEMPMIFSPRADLWGFSFSHSVGWCGTGHGETVREWLQPDHNFTLWGSEPELQEHVQAEAPAGEVAEWRRYICLLCTTDKVLTLATNHFLKGFYNKCKRIKIVGHLPFWVFFSLIW